MFYDLNVPYLNEHQDLKQTLLFLFELGYGTISLDHSITGKVPAEITNQIPHSLPFELPPALEILRRCTLHISDPSQNHRLSQLSGAYDIFAIRPTSEKAFQQACHSLECDIISLDFGARHPFYFQMKTVKAALDRGIKFEICYASGISNLDNGVSRRNLISNATQLIRATRGRGIVISSEAKRAVACRGPADVINLAVLWGLHQERGTEAVTTQARSVVVQAGMKRRSFRGVIDVIQPGKVPAKKASYPPSSIDVGGKRKRAAEDSPEDVHGEERILKPISKREQKRQAKKARKEALDLAVAEKSKAM